MYRIAKTPLHGKIDDEIHAFKLQLLLSTTMYRLLYVKKN